MSCYEWERGTIKIPAKEWSKFRKSIITEHNRLEDERLAEALRAHAKLLAAKKGKRGFDVYGYANNDMNLSYQVLRLLFSYNKDTRKQKFRKPKKKDLDKKPVSKDCLLNVGESEASIFFNSPTHTVEWDVGENNHACDNAHEQPLAKLFFRKLNNMNWTRGSGGKIIGNNEYNRDSEYEGGGGNLLKEEWPKKYRHFSSY
jgi:hypothetical protein